MATHGVLLSDCKCPVRVQEGEGLVPDVHPLALLPVLAEFLQLKDPGMLTLEVSGLTSKYPDIR